MDKYNYEKNIIPKGKNTKYSEEDDIMNACVMKPNMPFVTRKELKRTPVSDASKKISEFMDSHDFSFSVDKKTGDLKSKVTKR